MPSPTSVRLNPQKFNPDLEALKDTVPWCKEGRYLDSRPNFTADPLFWAGTYYVQEASSMIIGSILEQLILPAHPIILDLCAAPGGKSTHIASFVEAKQGLLVANEVIKNRANILEENLIRWGTSRWVVTQNDAEHFQRLENFFDVIVIDAPCSGEGMFRKEENALQEWSLAHVDLCSGRQRRIINDVLVALKPGGYLIYSTCTYNRHENEENLKKLLKENILEQVPIKVSPDWGIVEQNNSLRFFPHRIKGEGLFVACLRKNESSIKNIKSRKQKNALQPLVKKQWSIVKPWLNEDLELFSFQDKILALKENLPLDQVLENMYVKGLSLWVGQIKGNDFIPSHDLALSILKNKSLPGTSLELEQAQAYLKKEEFVVSAPKGWIMATYQGHNLGWMKVLPNRINNYYPNQLRIRMDL